MKIKNTCTKIVRQTDITRESGEIYRIYKFADGSFDVDNIWYEPEFGHRAMLDNATHEECLEAIRNRELLIYNGFSVL